MDYKQILKKYYDRLVREALIKSLVNGAIIGLSVAALLMGLSWFTTTYPDKITWIPAFNGTLWSILAAILVTAIATVIFYFAAYRPTMRDAAKRVDALGLEERAITMISMADSDNYIAQLQRENTKQELDSLPPTKIKLAVLWVPVVVACVLIVCYMTTIITPNVMGLFTPLSASTPGLTDEEVNEIIDEMLEQLRQEIEKAENVSDEKKQELNDIVDDLEESLEGMETTQEKIDKISETADKIHEMIQKEQTHQQIGDALQQFPNTEELGEAIEEGNSEKVEEALGNIQDKIEQAKQEGNESMSEELNDLAQSIDQALEQAGQEGDELTEALENLSSQLKDAAQKSDEGDMEAAGEKSEEALEEANQNISSALGQQQGEEKLDENIQGAINDAMQQLDPNAPPMGGEGDETGDLPGDGDQPPKEDEPPKQGNEKGDPVDTADKSESDPKENEYSMSFKDAKTPYTDEYDKYFEQEMARLENENISPEMREMIAQYFASMKVEKEATN